MTNIEQVYLILSAVSRGNLGAIVWTGVREGALRSAKKGEGGSRIYKIPGLSEFGRWATGVRVGKSAGHWPSIVAPV